MSWFLELTISGLGVEGWVIRRVSESGTWAYRLRGIYFSFKRGLEFRAQVWGWRVEGGGW